MSVPKLSFPFHARTNSLQYHRQTIFVVTKWRAQQEFWAFAAQLALSAFLASAVGCSELVEQIIPHTSMIFIGLPLSLPSQLGRKAMMSLPHRDWPPIVKRLGMPPRFMQAIVNYYTLLQTPAPVHVCWQWQPRGLVRGLYFLCRLWAFVWRMIHVAVYRLAPGATLCAPHQCLHCSDGGSPRHAWTSLHFN